MHLGKYYQAESPRLRSASFLGSDRLAIAKVYEPGNEACTYDGSYERVRSRSHCRLFVLPERRPSSRRLVGKVYKRAVSDKCRAKSSRNNRR